MQQSQEHFHALFFELFVFHALLSPFFTDTSNILTRIGLGDVNIPAHSPSSTPFPPGSQIDSQNHRGYRKFDSTYNARQLTYICPKSNIFEVASR